MNMVKLLIFVFACVNIGFGQNDLHSTMSHQLPKLQNKDFIKQLNDDLKNMQKDSDTMWLYSITKRYLGENNSYYLSHVGYIKYYVDPESADYGNVKTYVGIDPETNDSAYKHLISYDDLGREHERIFQYYDTIDETWDNNFFTTTYYDQYGYDSLTTMQSWNAQLEEWVDYQRHLKYRNHQEAIIFDVYDQWTGTYWHRLEGHKFEYFLDEDGCTDSTYNFLWFTDIDDWFLLHKWYLYYDENNVQTWGRDVVYDEQLGKWRNYQQTLDYEFDNWCGCDTWSCITNPTHFIIQNWYDTAWFNIERFNAEYDSLGGFESVMEYWHNSNWYLGSKTIQKFLPDGNIDILLTYVWNGDKWIEYRGYDSEYTFVNDTLIESVTVKWDTASGDWVPHLKVQYQNYIGLPVISSVEETNAGNLQKVKLIPNPSSGVLTIKLLQEGETIHSYKILDQSGRVVLSSSKGKHSSVMRTNISGLSTGVYMVRVRSDGGEVFHSKLIKK